MKYMSMPSILENHPESQEGQPDTEPDQHAKLDSLSGYSPTPPIATHPFFVPPLQLGNDDCKLIRRLIERLFVLVNRLLGMLNKENDKNTSHYKKKRATWTRDIRNERHRLCLHYITECT
jgi:hypothetical protein